MKNAGKCPKCSSRNIIYVPFRAGKSKTGKWNNTVIWLSALKSAKIDRYVCGDCGYTEEWIANTDDLANIKKKYS